MPQCRYCNEPIAWVPMAKTGRRNPLDAAPSPRGNVFVIEEPADLRKLAQIAPGAGVARDGTGPQIGQGVALGPTAANLMRLAGLDLYLSHWVTCAKADDVRRAHQARRA